MNLTPTFASPKQLGLLRTLAERMHNYGVGEDVRLIAAVILETARELDWAFDPEGFTAWLSQLALELAQTRPVRIGTSQPRAGTVGLTPRRSP